jgi:2'-5' RNA ligase
MRTVRAFLAIPLPTTLQNALASLQRHLSGALPGVRWSRPETIHLTLRFFGDSSADDLEKIRASMLSVTLSENLFQVDVAGLGAFPDRQRPRVVWLGLTPQEPLLSLYRACEQALGRNGMAAEARPFAPHLTIGRYRERGPDLSRLIDEHAGRIFGPLPVEQLVLFESRLHPGGAAHIPLFTAPLMRGDQLTNRTPQEGKDHG